MSRSPRHSLFDNRSYDDQPQKLQPNLFAKMARFSFRNAAVVLFFCCVFLAAASYFVAQKFTTTEQQSIAFSGTSVAEMNMQTLQKNFPHLDALATITLTNQNSELLADQRDALLENLKRHTELFDLVFSPGTGEYYDAHAILYLSKADIEARAAYALSLRPLFSAISQAPSAESLATLVNEVSASIKQGRDPQGLDELFLQSANALQALMQGRSAPVNWIKIANLDIERIANTSVILLVPKLGQEEKAVPLVDAMLSQYVNDKSTGVTFQHAAPDVLPIVTPVPTQNRLVLLIAMATILTIIATYSVLGRISFLVSILLPSGIGIAGSVACAALLMPRNTLALWPLYIGVAFISALIASRYTFALNEGRISGRSPAISTMLSAQKQGSGLVWQALIGIFIYAGFLTIMNSQARFIAVAGCAGVVTALIATFTVVPALTKIFGEQFSWAAGLWMEPLLYALFNTKIWRMLRTLLTWVAVGASCAGLYVAVAQTKFEAQEKDTKQIVNVIATSPVDAQSVLLKLKSIPEAASVRWLGAFLPPEMEAKQAVLNSLKNQFPTIGSLNARSADDLREQILTLQDSLKDISAEPATRPELRIAADAFRRSLALLSGTSTNVEIVEVENELFSRFNALPDRANLWAGIEKPSLESLDQNLKKLFLSADNIYRIEVIPAAGQSNAQLASVLAGSGLPVAHESLVAASQFNTALSSFQLVLLSSLAFGLIVVALAIGEGAGVVSLIATSAVVFAIFAGAIGVLHVKLNAEILMIILANCALLFGLIASAFLKADINEEGMPDALHAIEAWLPSIIGLSCTVPIYLLNIDGAKRATLLVVGGSFIVTLTIGFLLRPICLFVRRGN